MDIKIEENHDKDDSVRFEKLSKAIIEPTDNELNKCQNEFCTTNSDSHEDSSAITKTIDNHESCITQSLGKSELESEVTNLSSTLDSRDDELTEHEKECESSLDLSYKNKSFINSVESSLDNSESTLGFEKQDENLTEDLLNAEKQPNEKEKNVFISKINGSNTAVENVEQNENLEDIIRNNENIDNKKNNVNDIDTKEDFILNENSCSSSSSSVGLVIDQQPEFSSNTITSQLVERDKNQFKNEINLVETQEISSSEHKLKSEIIDNCKNTFISSNECSSNRDIFENINRAEDLLKENKLKRKHSFYEEDSKSNNDQIRSPQHKIIHLDDSYINSKTSLNLENNIDELTTNIDLNNDLCEKNNLKNDEFNKVVVQHDTERDTSEKSIDLTVDTSSPILRNQLVLKITDNDPGGNIPYSPKNVSNETPETNQSETPSSTTTDENLQNEYKNCRFNVPLSSFGNNYLYEKNDKLIALNSSDNLSKIEEDKFSPYKIKSEECSIQNENEIKDFLVKSSAGDFSNNLILNKLDLSISSKNLNLDEPANSKNIDETQKSSGMYTNSLNKTFSSTNETLIDLTNDSVDALPSTNSNNIHQNLTLTPKEKILQDWNKISSLPSFINQSPNPQDLNKQLQQTSSDVKRFDNAPFSNQVESSISNKVDTVTNYPNSSKLLNNPSWKFSLKYGKQNQNTDNTTNKSLKRSSKNLYQNNKSLRQNNLKKSKEYPIPNPPTNYHSSSIINSSQFNIPNKLNPPVIPPVYELSHTLNRHTEYKCSKCFSSNFKNIRELENHHKFCLYSTNSNESIFLNNQQQQQQLGLSTISNKNNSRIQQFPTGINNLIHNVDDVILNIPKESNLPNFRNILNKQQSPLFNINDKPIEITPNLNHYLTQVEQKHKNLLQQHHHHHLNHNQNLFSHSLDETIKRTFLQSDNRQQNLNSSSEQKLISENHNSRYGGLFNSAFQNRKKIPQLQQQQIPVSLLDNGNILDYPIIQDTSNIFEINESPLNFNSSGLSKNSSIGANKGLRRFSSSSLMYGSSADLSSNSLTVLNKQQLDNAVFPTTIQQKPDSLEPIMLKVKQNQFSPILPPDQLLNKLTTQTSFSSASSASSSFQESSNLNINSSSVSENLSNTENAKKKSAILERRNTETVIHQNKNNEKENKSRITPNSTQTIERNQYNNAAHVNNNENLKTNMTLEEKKPLTGKKTKKLFLCSSCGSYHENWNLFLHMREMHKRHICLVCLRMFPTAEQLTVHLEMKHDIEQNHFESQEKLIRSSRDSCYLMCCTCEHIFTEHDDFYQHVCANYLKPCTLCGLLGKHSQTCKYGTIEHKKIKRNKKIGNTKSQQKQQNSFNSSVPEIFNTEITESLTNLNQQLRIEQLQDENLNTCTNQMQLPQYSDCDRASNKEDNKTCKESQIKFTNSDSLTNIDSINEEHDSDSNNESDSDSNKFNGYLEHFNYNDNDLINLYKSNRIANLAKQKEKEEAEAKAKSNNHSELAENQIINISKKQCTTSTEIFKNKNSLETMNSEKPLMPKLTLKISKQLLNQAQNLADESEEQSSIETTDAEDNDDDNKTDIDENDTTAEDKQHNTSNSTNESNIAITEVTPENIEKDVTEISEINKIISLDSQPINKNERSVEEEKHLDENKNEDQIDDSKSDSDMDIDVTCNQGGDVAPISNIELQNENDKQTFPSFIARQEVENFSEKMQIDSESLKEITNNTNTPENNETDLNVTQLSQTSKENTTESEELSLYKNETILNEECNDGRNLTIVPEPEKCLIPLKKIPTDGIDLANEDVPILELSLDAPLDRISMVMLLRIMLKQTYPICLYCNHARRIAVNGNSLALHMLLFHRFSATVDSITAEELLPGTIITKLKSYLEELNGYYFNMETYCNIDKVQNAVCPTIDEKIFECFSCRFSTKVHKELYLHNRKMHLKTAIFCFMCRSNFYSYSEILCHICPGAQHKVVLFDIKFRCCICELDQIPSAFRLMVHLRKAHFACDVCLENCYDQSRLSSHVWKHKLHHLCYRCGIAYRNKPDITKHLFWKHGTESILCKRCLQKRWPHVYHFCVPPTSFVCEVCNLTFTRAMYLKVHKRLHSGDAPYPCAEDNCDKKFISRKLLLKHVEEHETIEKEEKINDVPESSKIIKEEMDTNIKKQDDEPQLKDEKLLSEDKNEEKVEETDEHLAKKKKKKMKRCSETKESLEDLNLQAPNLSESGSSDDSDTEISTKQKTIVPNVMLSPPSEQDEEEDGKTETNPEKIIDIWNNFKTFQATQSKVEDSGIEDSNFDPPTPILHVVQSDHDYCRMFKVVSTDTKNNTENEIDNKNLIKEKSNKTTSKNSDKNSRSLLLPVSPSKRKQKAAKKPSHTKSGSESSTTDGSSSSSDSSCTCGSNCSCSSTTDSSSDSSSSSDTDSSSSEGKKRIAAKKAEKEERRKRNRLQSENSSKANNSDVVDVVTTDIKPEPKLLEPVIYEDDLETDESDTDEDFYDEHPQKLASEILAEKRRQLMKQTCLSPSHNFDIVENSRPSTPSLPEDVYGSINSREKKPKIKKKKRERKSSNKNLIPPFKLSISKTNVDVEVSESPFIPPIAPKQINANGSLIMLQGNKAEAYISTDAIDVALNANITAPSVSENIISEISTLYHQSTMPTTTTISSLMYQNVINTTASSSTISAAVQPNEPISQSYQVVTTPSTILNPSLTRPPIFSASNMFPALLPAPINPNFIRHSTESSSDAGTNLLSKADNALKRSKRARRPNRFYGYSSDDETAHGASLLGTTAVFKPIPPPNLTWRKEDLPTPPRNILGKNLKTGIKSSLTSTGKKIKLFSKKKENPHKKDKQLGSKLMKIGNASGIVKPQIPKLKIKPLDILPQIPPSILDHQPMDSNIFQSAPQPPPVVEPINSLPPVPVHHIDPPQFYPSSKESMDSDSESDEDKLTIPIQVFNSETKPSVQPKIKKSSTPKTPKGNQNKISKKIKNNSSGPRTSYNSVPQPQISNLTSLQNIPTEIKEPAPPPPPKEKKIPLALLPNPDLPTLQYFKRNNIRYPIRPPAGARAPREGESVYCYCRCPYDEVSEMIACDGDDCMIEWFHFECVGILVAPQGKWFCAECKPNQQVYSSPQNTTLQQQYHQLPQQNPDLNYGNLSTNISGFNGPSNNNSSNISLGTNSGSMGY